MGIVTLFPYKIYDNYPPKKGSFYRHFFYKNRSEIINKVAQSKLCNLLLAHILIIFAILYRIFLEREFSCLIVFHGLAPDEALDEVAVEFLERFDLVLVFDSLCDDLGVHYVTHVDD